MIFSDIPNILFDRLVSLFSQFIQTNQQQHKIKPKLVLFEYLLSYLVFGCEFHKFHKLPVHCCHCLLTSENEFKALFLEPIWIMDLLINVESIIVNILQFIPLGVIPQPKSKQIVLILLLMGVDKLLLILIEFTEFLKNLFGIFKIQFPFSSKL